MTMFLFVSYSQMMHFNLCIFSSIFFFPCRCRDAVKVGKEDEVAISVDGGKWANIKDSNYQVREKLFDTYM